MSEDVVRAAEAYFQEFDIRSLLTRILVKLGRDQPADPVAAICAHLSDEAPKSPPGEEHDADESLLQGDLLQVLAKEFLPGKDGGERGEDFSQRRAWAGGFNRSVLESWVPQPSPCCGCASVAGAFNSLWRLERGSAGACSIREVAEVMAANCEKLQLQKQRRLERLLGVAEGAFEEFYGRLDAELELKGLSWTGKGLTKAVAMAVTRDVLRDKTPGLESPSQASPEGEEEAVAMPAMPSIFEALREVLGEKSEACEEEPVQEEELEQLEVEVVQFQGPQWKKEVSELLSKRQGVFRLRAPKPSTTEVGTSGLRQAAEDVASARGLEDQLKVAVLLARKGGAKCVMAVSKNDVEADVHRQWSCLKSAFSTPNTVLLFHLTNHYALVFAWREWQDEEVRLHRQILTARKGQRPSAWIDFDEVRRILLGWNGYHLLSLRRLPNRVEPQ